jgi:uncharacterized RDD family membrane protein YckC
VLEARVDTVARVETPEQVRFDVRLAGPARRSVAYIVDLLIELAVLLGLAVVLLVGGVEYDNLQGWSLGLYVLVLFAVEWGYHVFFETIWSGRTPGKRLVGLRVIKEGGYSVAFSDALLRNLLRAADFLPTAYALGLIVMAADGRFRRLGDWVAGTMVIVEARSHVGARVELAPAEPRELAAISSGVLLSAAELEAIELFVRRRELKRTVRAVELAELILPTLLDRLPASLRQDPVRALELLYLRAVSSRTAPR